LRKAYPDEETSRRLSRRIWRFPLLNWRFGLALGFVYALVALFFMARKPLRFLAAWLAGSVIGPYLLRAYFFIARNVVHRQRGGAAFIGLKIEDYKNFLRIGINPDGTLTIFPIGIEKAGSTEPVLIEDPITI
jgi:hypothetical protein